VEEVQEKALKFMFAQDREGEGEVSMRDIEANTGCDGLDMGDLLHRGFVQPVNGIATWELTSIGRDYVENYLS
jgi:hypothetical protein